MSTSRNWRRATWRSRIRSNCARRAGPPRTSHICETVSTSTGAGEMRRGDADLSTACRHFRRGFHRRQPRQPAVHRTSSGRCARLPPAALLVPRRWCAMRAKDLLGQQGEELAARLSNRSRPADTGPELAMQRRRDRYRRARSPGAGHLRGENQVRRPVRDPARGGYKAESLAAQAPCRSLDHRPRPCLRADQDRRRRGAADRP